MNCIAPGCLLTVSNRREGGTEGGKQDNCMLFHIVGTLMDTTN